MKKKIAIIAALLLVLTLLTACGTNAGSTNAESTSKVQVSENGDLIFDVAERGVEFEIASEYFDKGVQLPYYSENEKGYKNVIMNYFSSEATELVYKIVHTTAEERANGVVEEYSQKIGEGIRCLMEVTLVEADEYEKAMAAGGKAEDFTDYAPAEYFGTNEGYVYLISTPDQDDSNLTAEEAEVYHVCKEYMETVKKNIKLIPLVSEKVIADTMPEFKTKDLMGNEVTNEVFQQAEFTVVNVWETTCVACIDEMPELAQMPEKYAEKVQFIGIVGDVHGLDDTANLELAKKIVEKAGVKYTNLVISDDLADFRSNIVAFPTTLLVDSSGNVVDKLTGANPYELEKMIESNLAANN